MSDTDCTIQDDEIIQDLQKEMERKAQEKLDEIIRQEIERHKKDKAENKESLVQRLGYQE